MKNLNYFIEAGEKIAGGTSALEDALEVPRKTISMVKAGKRGLKTIACGRLADLLNEDAEKIIYASELVTEKNEAARKYYQKKLEAIAASVFLFVILNMTPTPSQAAPALDKSLTTLYIMSNCKRIYGRSKQWFLQALQMRIPKNIRRFLASRVDHVTA